MYTKIKQLFFDYLRRNKMSIPRNKDGNLDREIINYILAILDENGKVIQYIAITKAGTFFEASSARLEQLVRNSGIRVINVEAKLFKLIISQWVDMVDMQSQLSHENNPAPSTPTNG